MEKHKGLVLIAVVYGLAFLVGAVVYNLVAIEQLLLRVFVANSAATIFVFLMSTAFKNSTIYDPYWSVAPLVLVFVFFDGWSLASVLMIMAVYVWGLRLTYNWITTFKGLDVQDWRYDHFKQRSGRFWPIVNFFGIHYMPTVVVYLGMVPAYVVLQGAYSGSYLTFLAFLVPLGATLIQSVSDQQMHQHLATNPKQVLDTGLWSMSRHPNYFGEIMFWIGLYLMMLTVQQTWLAVIGAVTMVLLFVGISIPLMENRQLKRRPDYVNYQASTPMLVPVIRPFKKEQEV